MLRVALHRLRREAATRVGRKESAEEVGEPRHREQRGHLALLARDAAVHHQVRVGIDQAREQVPARRVDDFVAVGDRERGVAHRLDPTVAVDQHRGGGDWRRPALAGDGRRAHERERADLEGHPIESREPDVGEADRDQQGQAAQEAPPENGNAPTDRQRERDGDDERQHRGAGHVIGQEEREREVEEEEGDPYSEEPAPSDSGRSPSLDDSAAIPASRGNGERRPPIPVRERASRVGRRPRQASEPR